ncbi:MAG: HRDC domain-containing protein [Candidatus Thorarchaeota archaeon]
MTLFIIDPEKSYVYVLKLDSKNKYYVGYSSELTKRLDSHLKGKGAEFTKKHGVDRLVALVECNDPGRAKELEATLTDYYMRVYGKRNVRGAGYTETITVDKSVLAPDALVSEADSEEESMDGERKELFNFLRQVRLEIAREENCRAFMVFSNKVLERIVIVHPRTKENMLDIPGVGPAKLEKYGERFLQAIADFDAA